MQVNRSGPSPDIARHVQDTSGSRRSTEAHPAEALPPRAVPFPSDISPARLAALEAELASAGFAAAGMDAATLEAALLLHDAGLPLDMLRETAGLPATAVAVADAIAAARTLLARRDLDPGMRVLLQSFVDGMDALAADPAPRAMLETLLDTWTAAVERAFADAGSEGVPVFNSSNRAGGTVADGSDPRLAGARALLRDAVAAFRAAVLDGGAGKVSFDAALRVLAERLTAAAWTAFPAMAAGQGGESAALGVFVREGIRALDERLRDSVSGSGGQFAPTALREAVQRSGMQFEWRLLAWFRAGADPARLRALMASDIKGLLSVLAAGLRRHGGASAGMVGDAAERALASFGRRRLDAIVNDRADRHDGALLDLPAAGPDMPVRGTVVVRGGKQPGRPVLDLENADLSFSVAASRIGRMDIAVRIRGNTASLAFTVEGEDIRALGAGMAAELRDALAVRGLSATVGFSVSRDESAGPGPRKGVDLTG